MELMMGNEQPAQPQKEGGGRERFTPLYLMELAAGKLVYSDEAAAKGFVQSVRDSENPAEALAQSSMMVLRQVMSKIDGVDKRAAFLIAPKVIGMIAELAVAAKVMEPDPQILQAGLESIKQKLAGGQPQAQPQAQPQQQAQPQGIVASAMGG